MSMSAAAKKYRYRTYTPSITITTFDGTNRDTASP
jgi:hypothetical protein